MRAQSACDLCLREDVTTVIDHNHVTGGVRGVLCTRCNTGLGKFLDGVDLLKKAIAYLEDRDG
jgi:hypothetical protein